MGDRGFYNREDKAAFWMVRKGIASKYGIYAAIWLSELISWGRYLQFGIEESKRIKENENGEIWFWLTQEDMEKRIGMKGELQTKIVKTLSDAGIIQTTLKGTTPKRIHYRIISETYYKALDEYEENKVEIPPIRKSSPGYKRRLVDANSENKSTVKPDPIVIEKNKEEEKETISKEIERVSNETLPSSHNRFSRSKNFNSNLIQEKEESQSKASLLKYSVDDQPLPPKKEKKEYHINKTTKNILTVFNEVMGKSIKETSKGAYDAQGYINKIIAGTFANDKGEEYKQYKNKPITEEQIISVIKDRFSKAANNYDYMPEDKHNHKSLTLSEFFWSPFRQIKSYFFKYLMEEPKIVQVKYKKYPDMGPDFYPENVKQAQLLYKELRYGRSDYFISDTWDLDTRPRFQQVVKGCIKHLKENSGKFKGEYDPSLTEIILDLFRAIGNRINTGAIVKMKELTPGWCCNNWAMESLAIYYSQDKNIIDDGTEWTGDNRNYEDEGEE